MKVNIKQFDVEMEVKSKGIEFEIRDPKGKFLGDVVITMTSIIWCPGKTTRERGYKVKLEDFFKIMEAQAKGGK